MSLLFNMLSRLVIAFLPRSKHLLIWWLQSPSAVILEHPQNKFCHCFQCFLSICREVMGSDAMILVFWMLSFKLAFSLCSFTRIKGFFGGFPGDSMVITHLPMQETQVRSLGGDDSLVKEWLPTQYSCLEDCMYRGAWRATVHGSTKSPTWLNG